MLSFRNKLLKNSSTTGDTQQGYNNWLTRLFQPRKSLGNPIATSQSIKCYFVQSPRSQWVYRSKRCCWRSEDSGEAPRSTGYSRSRGQSNAKKKKAQVRRSAAANVSLRGQSCYHRMSCSWWAPAKAGFDGKNVTTNCEGRPTFCIRLAPATLCAGWALRTMAWWVLRLWAVEVSCCGCVCV